MFPPIGGTLPKKKRRKKIDRPGDARRMNRMPTALRRSRADRSSESARTIALVKEGGVAPFMRRPSVSLGLGSRRPARRLPDDAAAPAVSRIVLRALTLR
jgi:hypothetical protein